MIYNYPQVDPRGLIYYTLYKKFTVLFRIQNSVMFSIESRGLSIKAVLNVAIITMTNNKPLTEMCMYVCVYVLYRMKSLNIYTDKQTSADIKKY